MVGKLITALLLQASPLLVAGFPHIQKMLEEQKLQGRQIGVPSLVDFPEWPGAPNHATYDKFDPEAQRVSTSGEHEWRAPGPGDIRGPCSGLNGMSPRIHLSFAVDTNALISCCEPWLSPPRWYRHDRFGQHRSVGGLRPGPDSYDLPPDSDDVLRRRPNIR